MLKQAVLNVAINGVEAMEEQGTLEIEVLPEDNFWVVKVADTGHGIPEEIQPRIFNLYFTTKKNGSGIGLAMTFRILQLHNGYIDFVSEKDVGTTFYLRIPRVELDATQPELVNQSRDISQVAAKS